MQAKSKASRLQRCVFAVVAVHVLTGCTGGSLNAEPKEEMLGARIGAVAHYGANMGIPEFYVNGHWGGNNTGWGGGGAGVCCVPLPRKVVRPVFVKVKWETCDTSAIDYVNGRRVDPNAECKSENHEATVPVHFEIDPGKGGFALFIHFLSDGNVEAWYTKAGPLNPNYPGPKYPLGPAPASVPLSIRTLGGPAGDLPVKPAQGVQR